MIWEQGLKDYKKMSNKLAIVLVFSFMNFSNSFSMTNVIQHNYSYNNFSHIMICLSIFVTLLMSMVSSQTAEKNAKQSSLFKSSVMMLLMVMLFFFSTKNMILFYVTFELSLLPTMMLILKWGSQPERLQATMYFMLYTMCASLPLMYMLFQLYLNNMSFTMNPNYPMNSMTQMNYLMCMCMVTAFLVKLPMWGVHLWLPKAHVEAPLSGSMILAGILLKLGGYGLLKFTELMYKTQSPSFNLIFAINLWGAMLMGFVCMSSMDMKVLIAYSSVIHMNLPVLGVISQSIIGMMGAMLMMISHGIGSPGMFTMANSNYEKTKSRNILLNKSMSITQPNMMMMWFLLISANMAAPPSLNLASEILISMSVLKISFIFAIPLSLITMLGGVYNLYIYSAQLGNNSNKIMPFTADSSMNYIIYISQAFMCYFVILLINNCVC
uniref:NADH-ubiquinone oxidoreductase chain 4 n=1 Tax=Watersipora subtorquata TaxID=193294 RepID=C4MEG0_9BILA|nr:NADH dehydrogenase subunit 4 [Watersipora subtorquata]ABY55228.1 NADH dehydrogenase subunit 4 [Watersipora subtorquata]